MSNNITIKVCDITGKEILIDEYRVINNEYSLNFDDQKSGFYLITIKSNDNLFTQKVIVNRNN